ncbi:alpha/beta hydrolase [Streptomyces sp. p1417]|uniref:Alpha/beta hydrolase n=1 Tax=Streptomyces typhae TaxID=2681492 RepID=A0A6L6WP75_9ACTN|nr:alpha/beta hydrolase [Streptomyces typhae]MVO83499.1 alpha/beta hydrolase [Streptomyces typhae]
MLTSTQPRRRSGAVAALLVCALAGGAAGLTTTGAHAAPAPASDSAGNARAAARLSLPEPTGPHAVGRTTLHLADHTRRDPWVPGAGARELLVTLYHPALKGTGTPSRYMTTEGARLLLEDRGIDLPAQVLGGTRTHSRTGAVPAPGRYPLVILSPGFSVPGTTLTGPAEDLASRGYVVAVTDHAYEAVGVSFPGKGILPCAACGRVDGNTFSAAAKGRGKDLSFVLDALLGKRGEHGGAGPVWRHSGLIDARRVGAAGHSLGGAGAAAATAGDARIRAVANLDGPFADAGSAAGLSGRPVLMLGTAADHSPAGADRTWDRAWSALTGWKRWATVSGTDHFAFTDLAPLAGQLGEDDPDGLPGHRAAKITNTYVRAFFDRHLRGLPRPVLDGPSGAHPEVAFHDPAPRGR